MDLLTGWMLGALITPEEYRREYQVVQRELEMGKGEPTRQFWYMSAMNRYRVSQARVPVIGYQEVIQGLSRDDVYSYYKLAYEPGNMVFAVVGDLEPQRMLNAVQKNVNEARPQRVFSHDVTQEPPVLAPRTLAAVFPKIGQAKVGLAFATIKLSDPDLYALDLLAAVLGEGESSLLVEEIRDKRELASMITASSYTPSYVDGTFTIYMQADAAKIQAATEAVLAQLEKIKREGVDKQRVERAKTQLRAERVKSLQTAEEIASSLASDFMSTGDPHFSDRYVEQIQTVTPEQVQAAARKYLDVSRLLTTAMLPTEYVGARGLPGAEELLRAAAPTTLPSRDGASPVTRVELDNGTILLVKHLGTTPLVVMNMYALGGLTAEDSARNGLGNLAMEMLVRGTRTRNAQQISEFFDSTGGDINTGMGNNSWLWTATCLKENFARAMEVYADVVNNPTFPENELAQMKQRVLAQIQSQDADWSRQAMRYFKKTYFGPSGSPYQFLPTGTKETVAGFTRDQVAGWYSDTIRKSRRVLAIYGDVDVKQAVELAGKYLGGGEKLSEKAPTPPDEKVGTAEGSEAAIEVKRIEVQETQQPLAGVVIGFESESVIGEPAEYPLTVAKTMTGGYGYPTGYLHETLRGRGLVYVVHDQNWPGRNKKTPGTFFVYAGCAGQGERGD